MNTVAYVENYLCFRLVKHLIRLEIPSCLEHETGEMDVGRIVIITVSIGIALLLILPLGQYANGTQTSSIVIYRYGNEYVEFDGQNTYVGLGNLVYPVSWSVYMVGVPQHLSGLFSTYSGSSQISIQSFTSHTIRRIESAFQNSAVLTESNKNVRIAEIFTFRYSAVDASIAIENLRSTNQTYITSFSISMGHHTHAFIGGFSPRSVVSFRGMGNQIFPIQKQEWSLSTGKVTVNWESEDSIFNLGAYYSSPEESGIRLPFGPIALMPDETYSIDPVISSSSTAGTSIVQNPGSRGYGSTPPYPSLSNFQVTYASSKTLYGNVIPGDTALNFSVDYTNAGAAAISAPAPVNYPDCVTGPAPTHLTKELGIVFSAMTPGGIEPISPVFKPSGSGIQTFQWTAQPGYYTGFYVGMENGYGSASASINRPVYVYTLFPYPVNNKYLFFPDAANYGIVYNSYGIFTGIVSSALSSGINGIVDPSTSHTYEFSAGLWNQSRTLGVWYVSQSISFVDNTANGTGILPTASISPVASSVQSKTGYTNFTSAEQTIWNSIAYGLDMVALSPPPGFDLDLSNMGAVLSPVGPFIMSTSVTYPSSSGYRNHHTFSESGYPSLTFHGKYLIFNKFYRQYNLVSGNGVSLSYLFSVSAGISFAVASTNPSNLVMDNFMYSTQMTLMQVPDPNQGYVDEPAQLHIAILDCRSYSYWTSSSPATYTTSVSLPMYILVD